MPLYEYQCQKCGKRTEKIESVSGPHLKKCPHCGGKVERLQSAPAIQFKGSGWYVTDYAGKSSAKDPGSPGAGNTDTDKKESPPAESAAKESSAKESKDSKESKDNKAAKKK